MRTRYQTASCDVRQIGKQVKERVRELYLRRKLGCSAPDQLNSTESLSWLV